MLIKLKSRKKSVDSYDSDCSTESITLTHRSKKFTKAEIQANIKKFIGNARVFSDDYLKVIISDSLIDNEPKALSQLKKGILKL